MLSLFANPLNTRILRAHADGPRRLAEMREEFDWTPEATIRAAAKGLVTVGALTKGRERGSKRGVITALTTAGAEMIAVSEQLEAWLARCPEGPIPIDGEHVTVAVKGLTDGWSSTLMRELAGQPRTLTELSGLIPELAYPSLERRLDWMRTTGQIAALPKERRGTPYEPTDWLRRAMAPLCVAGRCERRYMPEAPPITDIEIETAFLMTLELVSLPEQHSGECLLASRTEGGALDGDHDGGEGGRVTLAGVTVQVDEGEIQCAPADLDREPTTWAIGSAVDWLDAVIDGHIDRLRIGGRNPQFALDLANALHCALFAEDR